MKKAAEEKEAAVVEAEESILIDQHLLHLEEAARNADIQLKEVLKEEMTADHLTEITNQVLRKKDGQDANPENKYLRQLSVALFF